MAPTGSVASKSVNANRSRKRVEVETNSNLLKRAKNGSAFTQCESCKKDVAVALISMHDCGLDAKIKMNLETTAVERPKESVAKKPAEKKKVIKDKEQPAKKVKKEKDPSKPKRPPTAFFLFMDDFRKTYKEAHPDNKKVSMVAKEGGEKWKSMTEEEKKAYNKRAAELKEKYQKALENPNDAENDKAEGESNDAVDDEECSQEKVEEVPADDGEGSVEEEEVVADDE
ncbi:high mobility group B protein 7-like [Rutidosis leptorrhynchoides]|uniref:high mobility group B protein 7-like n=1 Tax=Rutidosis leptorrhynchoides TaxID=125765 RepID=UPI003A9A3FF6